MNETTFLDPEQRRGMARTILAGRTVS